MFIHPILHPRCIRTLTYAHTYTYVQYLYYMYVYVVSNKQIQAVASKEGISFDEAKVRDCARGVQWCDILEAHSCVLYVNK